MTTRVTAALERYGRLIDWVTRIVGTAGLVTAIALYAGQHNYVQCQAAVNDALIARTRVLTEAANQERTAQRAAEDATRRLFTDPVLSKPAAERSPAERQRLLDLFAAYQTALTNLDTERRDADLAREQNPIPAPPSQRCG